MLERLVRDAGGNPARTLWFERDPVGAGLPVSTEGGAAADPGAGSLAASVFPTLPLREDWPEALQRDLVRDYLDWCAPYLLTLPGISETQRERFERAAKARALEVDATYRLYPGVQDPELINSLRVEARMRRAATGTV
jgi:hypothetical protein